jgi:hypothetical protein
MGKFGLKISGCFGDVLYSTPTLRYMSLCHGQKLDIETNMVDIFINNPYVDRIYNPEKGEFIPNDVICYDLNGHNFGESQKQIRTMHTVDYWSTHLGFTLTSKDKTLEFYPNRVNFKIPEGKYIVINPSKTWDCRTWSKDNWEKLSELVNNLGIKVVIVGKDITYGDDDHKSFLKLNTDNVIDLTNQLDLSQLWYLVNNSFAVITMASGLLPFAGTTDAFIIELGSATHPEYRTPFRNGSQDYKHKFVGGSCNLHCQSDMKYNVYGDEKITRWNGFRSPGCYENKPKYECHPSVNGVYNSILELIINKNGN